MFDVILVHSTSHAIRIEKILKRAEIKVKLIPVPRQMSSDCGVSIRIQSDMRGKCEEILEECGAPFDRIVHLES